MSFLDPILGPLLRMDPLLGIGIVSFLVSLIITLVYKALTDQDEMKSLKDDLKKYQKKLKDKELRKNPDKMLKVQQEMMSKNMSYMMKSMKPTLFTFIPIILIFGWLNANMAFFPLVADQPFTVGLEFNEGITGEVSLILPDGGAIVLVDDTLQKSISEGTVGWVLKGAASEVPYTLSFKKGDFLWNKDIIITPSREVREYIEPEQAVKENGLKMITVGNEKIQPLGSLSIFGWKPKWLGTYILFSLVFSIVLRKLLKIY